MKELQKDIKNGTFRHVYLLYGEEAYLRLQYRDRLIRSILPEDSGMNITCFKGENTDESAIIEQAETLPFFADRRIIRVDDCGLFSSSAELLPDYLKQIPDYCYLIFTESSVDKRSRMFKAVKTAGLCAEFAAQSTETLSRWVVKMLAGENLRIRRDSMDYFLARCGSDMSHIRLETDKLIHYCAGHEEVTRDDIDAVTTDRIENRVFDMITAVTEHRQKDAFALYADLLTLKEAPMRILYLIGMQYNRLLMVKEMVSEGYPDSQIAARAGMPPFAVKRARKLISRYTEEDLRAAVDACVSAEEDVKSGRISDRLSVEVILLKLS